MHGIKSNVFLSALNSWSAEHQWWILFLSDLLVVQLRVYQNSR
jgi:hypothetical protein